MRVRTALVPAATSMTAAARASLAANGSGASASGLGPAAMAPPEAGPGLRAQPGRASEARAKARKRSMRGRHLTALLSCRRPSPVQPIRILSYNVRYFGHGTRGLASTRQAMGRIAQAIAELDPLPAIVCLQEVETRS